MVPPTDWTLFKAVAAVVGDSVIYICQLGWDNFLWNDFLQISGSSRVTELTDLMLELHKQNGITYQY